MSELEHSAAGPARTEPVEARQEPVVPGAAETAALPPAGSQLSLWPEGAGGETTPASGEQGTEEQVLRRETTSICFPPQDDGRIETDPATTAAVEPAWTLTDLGAFVLFVFVVSLPAAFLGTAGVFLLLRKAFGWDLTVTEAYTRAPLIVAMQTGWEVLWLVFIYFTITVKYRRKFWEALRWRLGAHRPRNWLAAGAVLALVAQLYFLVSPTGKDLPIERLFSSPGSGYVLALFGIFVAPFVEEMVFRGFIYPVFERMWGLAAAVLLTALLFAVIHASQLWGGWEEIAAIFLVGVAFSYSRGKTGSLAPSYLMHLGYNMALFVSLFLSTDGFRTLRE